MRPARCNGGGRAHRGRLCVRWVCLVPEPSTRMSSHATVHALVIPHMIASVRSRRARRSREVAASRHISSMARAVEHWAARFGWKPNREQLVPGGFGLCVARTHRPISASPIAVQPQWAEVGVRVVPEPHGLVERGSNVAAPAMASAVVGSVAPGCSPERFSVVLRPLKISSLFRLSGGATHRVR